MECCNFLPLCPKRNRLRGGSSWMSMLLPRFLPFLLPLFLLHFFYIILFAHKDACLLSINVEWNNNDEQHCEGGEEGYLHTCFFVNVCNTVNEVAGKGCDNDKLLRWMLLWENELSMYVIASQFNLFEPIIQNPKSTQGSLTLAKN